MNLGTLYVQLSADSKSFLSSMQSASESVAKFAKEAKKVANEVAGLSGVLLAAGGAAAHLAAGVDQHAKRSMDDLKKSTELLAVQVYDVLKPAIESVTARFREAADFVAGLDPGIKANIASFAMFAAQAAIVATVLSKVLGVANTLGGALASMLKAIGVVGLAPLLKMVFVVGVLIGLVVVLHRAWRKNWLGIQEIVGNVYKWMREAFVDLGGVLKKVWHGALKGLEIYVNRALDALEVVEKLTGKNLGVAGLREGFKGVFSDLRSGEFFGAAVEFAKGVATDVAAAVTEEVQIITDEIRAVLRSALGATGGGKARQPIAAPGVVGSGKLDWRTIDAADDAERLGEALKRASQEAWEFVGSQEQYKKDMLDAQREQLKMEREAAEKAANAWKEHIDKVRAGAKQVLQSVLGATGALGSMISSVMEGAKAGGVWGAIIAAVMQVFQRMESFQNLLKIFEYGLVRLGEMLEPLFGPLFKFIGDATAMGTEILAPLFEALRPLFEGLVDGLRSTLPILRIVGMLFKALAPILKALASVIGIIFKVLEPIMRVFFEIARVVLMVILSIMDAVVQVWNALVDAAASMVEFVVNLFTFGAGGAAAAAEIRKAKGTGYAAEIAELRDLTWEQANATVEATGATWEAAAGVGKLGDTAREVAESLTNVPSGYKLALARYAATTGVVPPPGLGGSGMPPLPQGGTPGTGDFVVGGNLIIQVGNVPVRDLVETMQREINLERATRRGSSFSEWEF